MEDSVIYGDKLKSMIREMLAQYNRKNHDYGNSFEESLDEDGLIAAKVRIGDKVKRFCTLLDKESQVNDESIEDTLKDLATYCLMTATWYLTSGEYNEGQTITSLFNDLYGACKDDRSYLQEMKMKGVYLSKGRLTRGLDALSKDIKKDDKESSAIATLLFGMAKVAVLTSFYLSNAIVPKITETAEKRGISSPLDVLIAVLSNQSNK